MKDPKQQDDVTQEQPEEPSDVQNNPLQEQLEEYKSKYMRALADYQNYERRAREEKEQVASVAQASVILRLLPFLDNLDKAEVFIKDPGLKMIKDEFMRTLKEMGLEEVTLKGTQFDPHLAEAIDVVEGDKDDEVVEVLTRAFNLRGKLIRHGQVKVSRKKGQ